MSTKKLTLVHIYDIYIRDNSYNMTPKGDNMKEKKEKVRIVVRIEPQSKQEVDSILSELGITMTEMIRLLFIQIIKHRKIPFEIKLDNIKLTTGEKEC